MAVGKYFMLMSGLIRSHYFQGPEYTSTLLIINNHVLIHAYNQTANTNTLICKPLYYQKLLTTDTQKKL